MLHIAEICAEAHPVPEAVTLACRDADGGTNAGASAMPGTAVFHKPTGAMWIRCADGWVGVASVKAPNKKGEWKRVSAGSFANGHGLRKATVVFDELPL